jgi:hypothetical protein
VLALSGTHIECSVPASGHVSKHTNMIQNSTSHLACEVPCPPVVILASSLISRDATRLHIQAHSNKRAAPAPVAPEPKAVQPNRIRLPSTLLHKIWHPVQKEQSYQEFCTARSVLADQMHSDKRAAPAPLAHQPKAVFVTQIAP